MQGHDGLHLNCWIVKLHKRPTPGTGSNGGMCKSCSQYSTGKNMRLRFGTKCLGPEFRYRARPFHRVYDCEVLNAEEVLEGAVPGWSYRDFKNSRTASWASFFSFSQSMRFPC
jgi:hypothetical protein